MPTWLEYKSIARERGALAMELYIVESTPSVPEDEMMKHLPAHLAYQKEMESNKSLVLAGPVSDFTGTDMTGVGIIIYRAASLEEATRIAANDPMHKAGARSYTVRSWLVNEGSLFSINISLSNQRFELG